MTIKPNLLSEFTPTETVGKLAVEVHSPQCPICLNVDGRCTLIHDKVNATIIIVESFQTSGYIMKCLCCDFKFRWCTGNFRYGNLFDIKHEKQNDVLVPIEYFSKKLGVDVYKYS